MSKPHRHEWEEYVRDLKPSEWDGRLKGKILERCKCGRIRATLLSRLGYSIKEFGGQND